MSKLIIVFIVLMFSSQISVSGENISTSNCKWDNRSDIPCLEISGNISNSSKFSKGGINKILISKEQIEQSGAVDLIDVLKTVPDINITQSGPKGQQASMFMRGTNSNHTLVMINGVPINDQSTTQGLHDFGVDFLQTIHQIEIYPGSSASQFGTNAIGGAINIVLAGDFKNFYKISTDKNSNYEFSGNKTIIMNNSSLNIKLGTVKSETISAKGNSDDEKDGVKNYSANVNFEKFLKDKIRFYNTNYIRQTVAKYDDSTSNQVGYEGDNKMGSFQLGIENLNQNSKYNSVLYYNRYDREYDEKNIIDTYKSEVVGLKYDLSKTINQNLSLGVGSEYKYDWGYFDNNGSYEASTKGHSDNLSYYGNLGFYFLKNSNISFFARIDNHKQTGKNDSYKLNFEQNFGESSVGLSFMNGLRNPTLYELFGTDNYGYSGNKQLNAEKSDTFEIYSQTKVSEYLDFKLRAFKSRIKNNIEYISNKYQNDNDNTDLNQSGLNGIIKFKNNNTSIDLFSSFLSSKKENGSNNLRRPRKNYGINIQKDLFIINLGKFDTNISYNHYGKHFDTHSSNFSTIEMDSTDLIDFKISKQIGNLRYYFKISNVLKENFQQPHGYNQDMRLIKFGIKY
jgi:vitamin B12 transporter